MTNSPTFLAGAERSGTTLFRLLVDSHPEITCLEGIDYVLDAIPTKGRFKTLDEYRTFLETQNVWLTAGMTINDDLGSFEAVVDDFLTQRMAAAGKDKVAARIRGSYAQALRVWPDARFVHIVRDPRAVALSTKPFEWGGHVYIGIAKWIEEEKEWIKLTETLPADRHMEIRFEELVTDHVRVLTDVCEFMGVDFTEEMYSYVEETDFEMPIPAKADEWRSVITDKETRYVEARVGDLLEERGFEHSGLPPLTVTTEDAIKLKKDLRIQRWKQKLELHGWVGPAELIVRKAGISALHTPLKRMMNEHERANRVKSWREPGREYSYSPAKKAELQAKAN